MSDERSDGVRAKAESLGLGFSETDLNTDSKPPFTLFWQTVDYDATNVLIGRWKEHEIEEFDYRAKGEVSFGTGGPLTQSRELSCVFTATDLDAPHLIAGPKDWYHLFSRIRFAGLAHVEIDEAFDENFHVYCDDGDFARGLFGGMLRDVTTAGGERFGYELHSDGLLCYTPQLPPGAIDGLLEYAKSIAEALRSSA
jgi:hypothetical protein